MKSCLRAFVFGYNIASVTEAAWAEGRVMTMEQAVGYALESAADV